MMTPRPLTWILLLNRLLVLTVAVTFIASAMSIAYAAGQHTSDADSSVATTTAHVQTSGELRTNR